MIKEFVSPAEPNPHPNSLIIGPNPAQPTPPARAVMRGVPGRVPGFVGYAVVGVTGSGESGPGAGRYTWQTAWSPAPGPLAARSE
ncbi:hypothetical protein GCM10027186_33900 [Micromonospora schwarzwaldensis]